MHSKALLFLDLQNFALLYAILYWVHFALKISENTYISTFICRLCPFIDARPKRKHKKRYKEEKPGHFVFGKTSFPVSFAINPGLISPYSLGTLIINFYQTFHIVWNSLIIFKLNTRPFRLKSVAFRPKFCWDFSIRSRQDFLFRKCSRNLLHSKALLFPDLRNFSLLSAILYWVHFYDEKFWKHLHSTFICRL